nr:MAG TPA: hypothetical protein [Caudoviricetes sp.]DAU74107.1 MAG TPA: hypothetical protein [Crassvirales sp.]
MAVVNFLYKIVFSCNLFAIFVPTNNYRTHNYGWYFK